MERRRSWWGWGWADEALTDDTRRSLHASLSVRFGHDLPYAEPPRLDDLDLPVPRVAPPASLATVWRTDPEARAGHAYGRSYRDVVRGFRGCFDRPPDVVAYPGDEADVVALLDWCSSEGLALIPYGGGSSVVGGVESAAVPDTYGGVVTVDLTRLDRVLELDRTSRAARIQAGALGPVLEAQLRSHDLTLRHYPQSFEFSTLGGWLATRSGGHYATVLTHIDDLVESMRVVTPSGPLETRRLPGSGAGPSPDRLLLGSEGALGIITEAWMRLQDRPRHKASAGVHLPDLLTGAAAVRALAQSGLFPTNCRLLDPAEAMTSAGVTDGQALLVVGFESADHPVDHSMARALELCRDHGGTVPGGVRSTSDTTAGDRTSEGSVDTWRSSFLRAPYGRDALVAMSVIVETFETACTWERFAELHAAVTTAVDDALGRICGDGWVTCRFTHVYPDGPAPYFTVLAPGRPGSEVAMWDEIKAAAADAILGAGGTITHHHAVGRDHRPWYDRQRPQRFGDVLVAAKQALDPRWVLNPGVLVDRPG